MFPRLFYSFTSFVTFICIFFIAESVSAQYTWLHAIDESRVSLDVSHVASNSDFGSMKILSTIWFVSGDLRISKSVSVLFEVPYANFDYESDSFWGSDVKSGSIGNPLIGVKYGEPGVGPYIYGAFRIPAASEDEDAATRFGAYSFCDRLEGFLPELMSYTVEAGYRGEMEDGFGYIIDGGLTLIDPESDYADSKMVLNHKFVLNYRTPGMVFAAGYNGRYLLSEEIPFLHEKYASLIGFKAWVLLGNFVPGINFYFPLNGKVRDRYSYYLGLSLDFGLEIGGDENER